ncbi:MAG: beta-propeller domain-containing protein [Ideonella sp.]|nr:beta-propeller domain-containing protein [Ideonella sp.]MCC7458542.1 beta-propeller domain-containing protein [Nitrospira sp.]
MAQDVASTMYGAPAAPAPLAEAAKAKTEAADGRADSITNVQTAGVDEGGIVKRAGEYLIVLRRGRLFTVRVGGDQLAPVAALEAYAPGLNPAGAWYDELLVSGRDVVVVGYSYARGGTEIGLFELGADGTLRHRATHHLRSFDYYSSRNYASRLIGRRLVFYTPTLLSPWAAQPWAQFPAARHWHGETGHEGFTRILPATRVYRTDDEFEPGEPLALHTITSCELRRDELHFESTAVLGPAGRVFYVSQGSVYVWTSRWPRRHAGVPPFAPPPVLPRPQPQPSSLSAVFRIPLDGSEPTALKTAGVPIDQMSFLEHEGHLNVLLKDAGRGEGMWGGDAPGRALALLRVPLAAFGSGHEAAQREHYRGLPTPAGGVAQNRFVGTWLLWGACGRRRAERVGDAGRPRRQRASVRAGPRHRAHRGTRPRCGAGRLARWRPALQRAAAGARRRGARRPPRAARCGAGRGAIARLLLSRAGRRAGPARAAGARCRSAAPRHLPGRRRRRRGAVRAQPRAALQRSGRTAGARRRRTRRWLQGQLRRLVRQRAAHLPRRSRAGADGLRNRRRHRAAGPVALRRRRGGARSRGTRGAPARQLCAWGDGRGALLAVQLSVATAGPRRGSSEVAKPQLLANRFS